jgi:hypothetical protein
VNENKVSTIQDFLVAISANRLHPRFDLCKSNKINLVLTSEDSTHLHPECRYKTWNYVIFVLSPIDIALCLNLDGIPEECPMWGF